MNNINITLFEIILNLLKDKKNEKLTAFQIAEWIFENKKEFCENKREKSKNNKIRKSNNNYSLIREIAAEVTSFYISKKNKKDFNIKRTENRPHKYYYSNQSSKNEVLEIEKNSIDSINSINSINSISEHDLYSILAKFLWHEFKIYSMRINEKHSKNIRGSEGNKWIFPDIVSLEDLSINWIDLIRNCLNKYGDKKSMLWSFEVKKLINGSNVRSAFFQTISNSSWANYSYLATMNLEGKDTLSELRMLTSLHGIGLIYLNPENYSESYIDIPAKKRSNLDWTSINRLAEINKDFQIFIEEIKDFQSIGKTKKYNWNLMKDI